MPSLTFFRQRGREPTHEAFTAIPAHSLDLQKTSRNGFSRSRWNGTLSTEKRAFQATPEKSKLFAVQELTDQEQPVITLGHTQWSVEDLVDLTRAAGGLLPAF